MTLCSTGSLSILGTAGTNRSISQEVDGNTTPPKSLTTLSESAGKSAPHSMLEFYGYTCTSPISVNPTQINFPQTNYKYEFVCVDTTPTAGCFNIGIISFWLSVTKSTDFLTGCCGVRIEPTSSGGPRIGSVEVYHLDYTNETATISVAQNNIL